MDFISKFMELMSEGYELKDITENIYLNYNAYENNDLIYKIKRSISTYYHCDLNAIKLIGSAQTGFSLENNDFQRRDEPADYDFAILQTSTFIDCFHKTNYGHIKYSNRKNYISNLISGKIHPYYESPEILSEINSIDEKIQNELNLTKKVTVCFYISENAFIKNLCYYFRQIYAAKLSQIASSKIKNTPELDIHPIENIR